MTTTKTFHCKKCKGNFKSHRNLLQHQERRVCRERQRPRLKSKRIETAKARARELDAARKRRKYVRKLLRCNLCAGPARRWVGNKRCRHALHYKCYLRVKKEHMTVDPVFGRRSGLPLCPYCRAEWDMVD